MKIQVLTSPETIEAVNCILGKAIDTLMDNGKLAKSMELTARDLVKSEQFRKRMLQSYLKGGK